MDLGDILIGVLICAFFYMCAHGVFLLFTGSI